MEYSVVTRKGSKVNVRSTPEIGDNIVESKEGRLGSYGGITEPDAQGYRWLNVKDRGFVREDVVEKQNDQSSGILKVKVNRLDKDDVQSLGMLTVLNTETKKVIFHCKTLELPDKNNANNISCIPEGIYRCEMTYSPAFKKNLYLIQNVSGRSGVRIHSANYVTQLRGCIALGATHKDINADGTTDLTHSGNTMKEFEHLMENKPFMLEIV